MSKDGPKGPARKTKTPSEGVAGLPISKSRQARFKRLATLAADERFAALMAETERQRAHPDFLARQRIEAALQDAHLDAQVLMSPQLTKFVWLMRELIADFVPGETLEQLLEPLHKLLSSTAIDEAADKARAVKKAQAATTLAIVEAAYRQLEPRNQGRNAASLIKSKTGLSTDTIRVYLKQIKTGKDE